MEQRGKEVSQLMMQISDTLLRSLNSAMAASDLMARQLELQSESESRDALAKQLAALRHNQFQVLRVADNMKTLAGLELKTVTPDMQTTDLWQLCFDLADSIRVLVPDIPVKLLPADDSFLTLCDPRLIEKLLLNLISNSLLHCEKGCEVRIQILRTEDTLQIIVADNGRGIARDNMDHLFSGFLRETDFSDPIRGAGLGLSVAEAIAKAHQGSLVLTSEPAHGTKAVFSLPHAWAGQFRENRAVYQSNGHMRTLLMELSNICDFHKFQSPFL